MVIDIWCHTIAHRVREITVGIFGVEVFDLVNFERFGYSPVEFRGQLWNA